MEVTSTPLISYDDIKSFSTDLVADAFYTDLHLNSLLPDGNSLTDGPGEDVLADLFSMISLGTRVQ